MAKTKLKFKRNESFYIRSGWFEKAIQATQERELSGDDHSIFYKNDGVGILGIGANMVSGLKYWLSAAEVIDTTKNNEFKEFGKVLCEYDPYMESRFSWLFVHYFLVRNHEDCPIFNEVYNSDFQDFSKTDMNEYLLQRFADEGESVNSKYVEADLNVFLRSYINENPHDNPENNYVCPLSSLKLLKKEKGNYRKVKLQYRTEDRWIVYYVLQDLYHGKPFNIEDSINAVNSPVKVFNMDKYMYLQYLDDLKKDGLINVTKTAGLNTVDFCSEEEYSIFDMFEKRFGNDVQ